jgi:ankyrin repeat protein
MSLFDSCINGDLNEFRRLIANGANVNEQHESGLYPLHIAVCNSRLEIIRELISCSADVNVRTFDNHTPVALALWNGQYKIIKELIKNKPPHSYINEQIYEGCTLLHFASINGMFDFVKELLDNGADANIKDDIGNTCLHYVVSYDIFSSLVNLKTIRIINSSLTTKQLNNLLYYVNAYSVYHLDLTGSSFTSFDEKDLIPIKSLLALGTLIIPSGMDESNQKILKTVLGN